MDNNVKLLIDVLLELKNASREKKENLKNKYNMVFMGKSFNVINSLELAHYLKNHRNKQITHEYLLEKLPKIASSLGMSLDPLVALEDIRKGNKISNFLITLF